MDTDLPGGNLSNIYEKMDVNLLNAAVGTYLVVVRDENGKRMASGKVLIIKR